MEELTPFHQRKDLQGGVYEEHSGYIPPFFKRMFIRISQKTMSCLIPRKFFGGKNKLKYLFGRMIIEMKDITNSSQENEK